MVNPNSAQLGHCCRGFQGFCQWDGPCTWPANLKISGYPSECNCCARWVSMPKGGFWFTWNDTSFSGELNWQRHPWQFVLLTRESKAHSYFLGKRKDLDCWNERAGKWDFSALTKGQCWHEPRSQGFLFPVPDFIPFYTTSRIFLGQLRHLFSCKNFHRMTFMEILFGVVPVLLSIDPGILIEGPEARLNRDQRRSETGCAVSGWLFFKIAGMSPPFKIIRVTHDNWMVF